MKFMAKFRKEKQIDPRSHSFVDTITGLLREHGIEDKRKLNECFLKMLSISTTFYRTVQKGDLKASDEEIVNLEEDMREVLEKYGITDAGEQEEIITKYFITINELGEQG